MLGCPHLGDCYEFWHVGSYRRRNRPCQISCWSLQGFGSSGTPNFHWSIGKGGRSYNSVSMAVLHCDDVKLKFCFTLHNRTESPVIRSSLKFDFFGINTSSKMTSHPISYTLIYRCPNNNPTFRSSLTQKSGKKADRPWMQVIWLFSIVNSNSKFIETTQEAVD